MAEAVGLASGVLALSVFAFKSGNQLYNTIQSFGSHPYQVRELLTELASLTSVLKQLSEADQIGLDIDLSALTSTLKQCKQACDDVELELLACSSRSGTDRTSFRDWLKLKCSSGGGIEGFRQQLIGYKLTITVALSFANLCASSTTAKKIQDCRALIATATVDLEAHFEDVQQKLETMTQRAIANSRSDAVMRHQIEDELRNTEKGIQFCGLLSEHIEKMQIDLSEGSQGDDQLPNSASEMLLGEGLQGCMHHMHFTLGQLEQHRERIASRLGSGPISPEDQALLDGLRAEASTVKRSLEFCSGVDAHLESQISNIENHAEGDDTIQFMVSTNGKPVNGKNRGLGKRIKQAGGHFGEATFQQLSEDFKSISIHQTGNEDMGKSQLKKADGEPSEAEPPFDNRHGRGYTLAKHSSKTSL